MPYKLREYDCDDCGVRTRRNRASNDPRICAECGVIRRNDGAKRAAIVSAALKRGRAKVR